MLTHETLDARHRGVRSDARLSPPQPAPAARPPGREDAAEPVRQALQAITPFLAAGTLAQQDLVFKNVVDGIIAATPMRALDAVRAALEQRAIAAVFSGTERLSAEQIGRLPPPAAGSPALRTVPPGTWWRVHQLSPRTGQFAPHAFNTSGRRHARFSPLRAGRRVVPTLYASQTLEGALMETVLHDVPFPSEGHIHDLQRDLQSDLHASRISLTAPLKWVGLGKLGLQRMGLRVSQMFESDACDCARTQAWARWLHATVPQAQGLYWMCARQPECAGLMLFGDRAAASVVAATAELSLQVGHPQVLGALLALLHRLGCGVAPDR